MAKKKRYHQSKVDRRHEREGMEYDRAREPRDQMMAGREDFEMGHAGRGVMHDRGGYGESMKRRYDNSEPVPNTVRGLMGYEAYAGKKESRKMMARDGAMIREDMSAPALLPQRIIEEYWPRAHNYNMGYVDDLFYGAQKQMHEDYEDLGREMRPGKY